jgi:hypothetical protein
VEKVRVLPMTVAKGAPTMTSERTQSYSRVVRTLDELGPTKLLATEQERIRDAADTLIFSAGVDAAESAAIADVEALVNHLVESGRWTAERAEELRSDLLGCGPLAPVPA